MSTAESVVNVVAQANYEGNQHILAGHIEAMQLTQNCLHPYSLTLHHLLGHHVAGGSLGLAFENVSLLALVPELSDDGMESSYVVKQRHLE
jgi:hypothetical protein